MGVSGAGPHARRAARGLGAGLSSAGRAGASAARGTGRGIRRMTQASGASRTGLDRLIELTAAGAAADAFVAVALAGTLFFSTSVDQARGRIALTLLITMAPFAVLAPFIGPMLDRVRDGRRYIMIGTLLARGLLCWGMAGAAMHNDTLTLLPAAFGVLVLQKAYGVTRSAVTPRLLPAKITLVSANARISLAALIASTLGAAAAAGLSFIAGGGSSGAAWVLRAGTVAVPGRDRARHQAAGPGGPARAARGGARPAGPGLAGQHPGAPGPGAASPGAATAGAAGAGAAGAMGGRPEGAPALEAPARGPRTARPGPGRCRARHPGRPGGRPPCGTSARSSARRCAATRRSAPSPAT